MTGTVHPLPTQVASLLWVALLHATWFGLAAAPCVGWLFRAVDLPRRARRVVLSLSMAMTALTPAAFAAAHAARPAGPTAVVAASARAGSAAAGPGGASIPEAGVATSPGPGLPHLVGAIPAAIQASMPYALPLWGVAVAVSLAALAMSLAGMTRLASRSAPAPDDFGDLAARLARPLGVGRVPPVRVHPSVGEPCLCGLFRPTILLPGPWLGAADSASLEAVLAHELAHAVRRDPLWNTLQRLLEAVLPLHPGVRWLSAALRREREVAADALAAGATGNPLALARALESVARLGGNPARRVGVSFGGHEPALFPRIQELLGMKPATHRPMARPLVALSSAFALALATGAPGSAQDGPAPLIAPPPAAAVPETSFEVQAVEVEPDAWRDGLAGRIEPLGPDGASRAWLVDGVAAADLAGRLRRLERSKSVQAPKVTTYDNSTATLVFSPLGEPAERAKREGPPLKTVVLVSGSSIPGGTRVSAVVKDSPWPEPGPEPAGATPRPGVDERYRGSCEVPEGSTCVVSLGQQRPRSERLFLISPRRVEPAGPRPAPAPAQPR